MSTAEEAEIDRLHEKLEARNRELIESRVEVACLRAERNALLAACKAVMAEWREGYGLNCVEQVRAAIKSSG